MIEINKILDIQKAWQAASPDDEVAIHKLAFESMTNCIEATTILSKNLKEIGYVWVSIEQIPLDALERNIET